MTKLLVSEIFNSYQGEGPKLGTPTVFVRLFGCDYECDFCDSKFSRKMSEAGTTKPKSMTIDEIVACVDAFGVKRVCITGGSPLLQAGTKELIKTLHDKEDKYYLVSLETHRFYTPEDLTHLYSVSFSPKIVKNKYDETVEDVFNFIIEQKLDMSRTFLKFVGDEITKKWLLDNVVLIHTFLSNIGPNQGVYIQPCCIEPKEHIEKYQELHNWVANSPYKHLITPLPRLHILTKVK